MTTTGGSSRPLYHGGETSAPWQACCLRENQGAELRRQSGVATAFASARLRTLVLASHGHRASRKRTCTRAGQCIGH
jgi:hypothetical protein